ncbi:uncharacterized protein ASPGLDRAFT_23893 [Aspergillus glaucus CBS 516.65]|uniref:Uncharacterized protein n=1 Tax=Aspergillus glaucus CBS 516.65 TaxID=1160497 RepID=A0A1L9VS48_ASPGL|nr:hypothetical protein ASPGLDRAFT_23893 [Aspergillus glaucus CBS 516.65]OJJ86739.1 hypothetical protein ASPGLDRAFT_23893 [Aspergillus glaucus CBS 516.65]
MSDSRLPELLPRRRRQHTFSTTDIDIQQLLTIFNISPANPNTPFWLLDKEEIVFQSDDIGTTSTYTLYYTVSKTNSPERILKSHNPITRSLSLGSVRAKLRLSTIIGLTLNQARLSEWQYDSHEALQRVESVGSRREIGVDAMYEKEMLAVLGGEGSQDEVLGIINMDGSETVCFLPIRLYEKYIEYFLQSRNPKPFPSSEFPSITALCEAVLRHFSQKSLLRTHEPSAFSTPEFKFHEEWYRAFNCLVGRGVALSSEWSFAGEGCVDFRIKERGWGIEIVRDGDRLDEHCE